MAAVHLFHLAVDGAQIFLLSLKVLLGQLDDHGNENQRNRNNAQGNQRHLPADGEHHDEHADDGAH